ncbi:MAG: anaerobic ribonucleoside-triphosphate reductase activating protein [Proteobacteria bacterium]|nr:anaerobic ribonucleoside-triphosphate reductase activating protein [Pseudomonadota bacterium]
MEALRVGGITPMTTIDFPGKLAAVVFCQGCPWRCGYCHNPHLLEAGGPVAHDWSALLTFLERRRGLLDAVVFSGGEPTLQTALPEAMTHVRELGFEVGLHTAGMYPQRLKKALATTDWVGFDVKAPWDRYDTLTGAPGSGERARASLAHLLDSGVAFECRTTWHAGLYSQERLLAMGEALAAQGVRHWTVQGCRLPAQLMRDVDPIDQSIPIDRLKALRGLRVRLSVLGAQAA